MTGMGGGLDSNNPTVVSAFHRALLHQGLIAVGILFVVAVVWNVTRAWQLRQAQGGAGSAAAGVSVVAGEPAARKLLRISFGLIWIFDGDPARAGVDAAGHDHPVIQPAGGGSSPGVGAAPGQRGRPTIWSYHPVPPPAAAVWIQIGIGLWLLAAPRGNWSRLAGVASCGWGLVVWVFGEAFGGIFAPGLTWLFGAPGAVLFYCVAGVLGGPARALLGDSPSGPAHPARWACSSSAWPCLQAWPGRGFWQGQVSPAAGAGNLDRMVQQMAQTPQPHLLSSAVAGFAGFDAAHGWAVNLFVVVALAPIGARFPGGRPAWSTAAVIAGMVLCLADWVLVEDFGFLGGVGTDPNSMIPMALVFMAGYVAMTWPARRRIRPSFPSVPPARPRPGRGGSG